MTLTLLFFGFEGIVSWILGFLALCLFLGVCYLIGLVGLQIRKGIEIMKYLGQLKNESAAKGQPFSLNDKGIALKKDGQQKIWLPIIAVTLFYVCAFVFIPSPDIKLGTLGLLIPATLGYFNIFLVPSLD